MKKLNALLISLTLIISGQCFAGISEEINDKNLFDLGIGPSTQSGCEGDFFGCGQELP